MKIMSITDAVISSVNVTSATELEVRCNPAGEIDAGDYPNATLELVVAHFTPSGEHSETLIIPIHLVVE